MQAAKENQHTEDDNQWWHVSSLRGRICTGDPFAGFLSLRLRLPVCQTLSPRLPPIFALQLAGTGPWLPELLDLFVLINGISRMIGMRRERDW